jgi:cytochrome c-type biogenesis protein CcmH/NrfG
VQAGRVTQARAFWQQVAPCSTAGAASVVAVMQECERAVARLRADGERRYG